jgi:hypothetical protein
VPKPGLLRAQPRSGQEAGLGRDVRCRALGLDHTPHETLRGPTTFRRALGQDAAAPITKQAPVNHMPSAKSSSTAHRARLSPSAVDHTQTMYGACTSRLLHTPTCASPAEGLRAHTPTCMSTAGTRPRAFARAAALHPVSAPLGFPIWLRRARRRARKSCMRRRPRGSLGDLLPLAVLPDPARPASALRASASSPAASAASQLQAWGRGARPGRRPGRLRGGPLHGPRCVRRGRHGHGRFRGGSQGRGPALPLARLRRHRGRLRHALGCQRAAPHGGPLRLRALAGSWADLTPGGPATQPTPPPGIREAHRWRGRLRRGRARRRTPGTGQGSCLHAGTLLHTATPRHPRTS